MLVNAIYISEWEVTLGAKAYMWQISPVVLVKFL